MRYSHVLPRKYIISKNEKSAILFERLKRHLSAGNNLIQLRAKELPESEYRELASTAVKLARKSESKLILNSNLELVRSLDADGIHLTSKILMSLTKRPLPTDKIVSAACHNAEELLHAQQIQVDFVTLSPVLQTPTHPEAEPLGWGVFSKLASSVDLPVYALGGMKHEDLATALEHGGQGVAGINHFWHLNHERWSVDS